MKLTFDEWQGLFNTLEWDMLQAKHKMDAYANAFGEQKNIYGDCTFKDNKHQRKFRELREDFLNIRNLFLKMKNQEI